MPLIFDIIIAATILTVLLNHIRRYRAYAGVLGVRTAHRHVRPPSSLAILSAVWFWMVFIMVGAEFSGFSLGVYILYSLFYYTESSKYK